MLADLILTGGIIFLRGDGGAQSDAIAVLKGRVVAIGAAEVAKRKGPKTRIVDLRGATALPGLIDAHAHLVSLARSLHYVDLKGAPTYEEVIRRVLVRAKATADGEWIVGRGWDQNLWPVKELPRHGPLSQATPKHPVYLRRIDGHAALLNRAAMQAVGIVPSGQIVNPKIAGGRVVKDETQAPTGVLIDKAMALAEGKLPRVGGEALRALLKQAMARVAAAGITAVHEMGLAEADLAVVRKMAEAGELTVRLVVYVDGEDEETFKAQEARGPEVGVADGWLTVRGVKFFADGALGSRGAALLAPYADDPKNVGLLIRDKASLTAAIARATKARLQVAVHAIGDRANRVALEALEAQAPAAKPARPRIEHAQVVQLDDIKRLKATGAIASMQPTHCTSDMRWVPARLGASRIGGAYAWRSMLEAGVPLAFGSDFPVEEVEPLRGLVAATSRADDDGFPAGGWNPWQRLLPQQALQAFTEGAAYAAFDEAEAGAIAEGTRADFSVLSANPFAASAADLRDVRVVMTLVAGRVVFEAADTDTLLR